MDIRNLITDPYTLATIIMLFYTHAFDLFEIVLQTLGLDGAWLDGALRKRIVAAILAVPFAFVALWVGSVLFPDQTTFEFNAAILLAEAIFGFVVSQILTFPIAKTAGILLSSNSAYRQDQ